MFKKKIYPITLFVVPKFNSRKVISDLVFDPRNPGKKKVHIFFNGNDYTAILAITKKGKIIIIKEYFEAPQTHVWHIMTGGREGNETFQECANREVFEESGYHAKEIKILSSNWHSMRDSMTKTIHCVALGCELDKGYDQKKEIDKTESIIEVKEVTVREFMRMIKNGEIIDNQSKAVFTSAVAQGYIKVPLLI